MKCNLCGFRTPPPDPVSIVLMDQHLLSEHDIKTNRKDRA